MSELDVSDLLSIAEAISIIDGVAVSPRVIERALAEAHGLHLAQEVRADRDYPPFDKSLMDGFAVRAADVQQVPAELTLVGQIAAGQQAERPLEPGQTMSIMTGAPLPAGADCIVPVEDSDQPLELEAGQTVHILRAAPGRYIARRGSDCAAGQVLLEPGTKLGAAALAVAASVGAAKLNVFDAPRVAVLGTGDELIPFDQSPQGSQIRNSNNVMLVALLRRLGCAVRDLGTVPDEPERIRAAMADGMNDDALIVSGGMSVGERDWCPLIMRELGVELKITKLKIKPGKPFVFGVRQGPRAPCYVFGLPGNPVSGFVCTIRLVSRLMTRLTGGAVHERWIRAELAEALPANGPREFYQPAIHQSGKVIPLSWKGSADIFTLSRANALLVRAENEPALTAGALVKAWEI